MGMERTEKIQFIAKKYGYDAQSRQCTEECAELIQAINKVWRNLGHGQSTTKKMETCVDNLIEELADVQIMVWQMIYLIGSIDIFDSIIDQKLDRTIANMKNEQSNNEDFMTRGSYD